MSKKFHFIGIAGKATAPIAIMLKQQGHEISGSDENVFEPALSLLSNNGVKWAEGYDGDRVEDADVVVVGGAPLLKDINNVEFTKAKELGKEMVSFPKILEDYVIKDNSVVVCGNYGKTTTASMMAWLLENADYDPSFLIGGVPQNFDTGVKVGKSNYSVMEGDEFVAAFGFDMEPKAVYYKPTHMIISSAEWDHVDVYPTENDYLVAYEKFMNVANERKAKVYICASGHNNEKVLPHFKGEYFTYMVEGKTAVIDGEIDYFAKNIKYLDESIKFSVEFRGEQLGEFESKMIGGHNVENHLATIAVAHQLGVKLEKIQEGITTYKGIRRRQEIRGYLENGATIMDDFAHSAVKAKSTLEGLRTRYKDKIIAIYYPRMSARANRDTLKDYPGTFDEADEVIIPRITVKKSTPKEDRIYGKDFVEAIGETQKNVQYIPRHEDIAGFIKENSDEKTLVVFMSAGGWGNLIEELIGEN